MKRRLLAVAAALYFFHKFHAAPLKIRGRAQATHQRQEKVVRRWDAYIAETTVIYALEMKF